MNTRTKKGKGDRVDTQRSSHQPPTFAVGQTVVSVDDFDRVQRLLKDEPLSAEEQAECESAVLRVARCPQLAAKTTVFGPSFVGGVLEIDRAVRLKSGIALAPILGKGLTYEDAIQHSGILPYEERATDIPNKAHEKLRQVMDRAASVESEPTTKNMVEEAEAYARTKAGKKIEDDKRFVARCLCAAREKKHPDLETNEAKERFVAAINDILGTRLRLHDGNGRCKLKYVTSRGKYSSIQLYGYDPEKTRGEARSFQSANLVVIEIADVYRSSDKDLQTAKPV